jgi:hypothetical protein
VARTRYLSMNNARAQSAQRSPGFGCYALRARSVGDGETDTAKVIKDFADRHAL